MLAALFLATRDYLSPHGQGKFLPMFSVQVSFRWRMNILAHDTSHLRPSVSSPFTIRRRGSLEHGLGSFDLGIAYTRDAPLDREPENYNVTRYITIQHNIEWRLLVDRGVRYT